MRKPGTPTQPTGQTRRNDRMRKLQSGQSMAEVAVSMVILVMLFSAIVDFGRAFFTVVALNNMISEGAHWAAAYPQCIVTANNATSAPQVDPKCRGTNSIIGRMLNENQDLDQASIIGLSITAKDTNGQPVALTGVQTGNDLTISVTYQMPTITPVIRSLFGNSLTLSAEVKEVVRGKDKPETDGTAMTNNGSVPPAYALSGIQQLPAACNNGVATLQWTAVSATGYHIYKTASVTYTGNIVTNPATSFATISPSSTIGTLMTWTDTITSGASLGTGGSQVYTITSYNDNGTIYDSAPTTITASCAAIKPAINPNPNGWLCTSGGTYGGATFNWTMPAPTDTAVTGYQILRSDGLLMGTVSGGATTTGTISFTASTDKTKAYIIRALAGGSAIGNASDPVTINCAPGTGLQGQYFNNVTMSGSPVLTRTEAVNFNWVSGSPGAGVNSANFSIRWTGQVLPPTSGSYTFYVNADDGMRLYVNGVNILEDWTTHSAYTKTSTPVTLTAGQRANIVLEYYNAAGVSSVNLQWSGPSVTQQVISAQQLYPPGS